MSIDLARDIQRLQQQLGALITRERARPNTGAAFPSGWPTGVPFFRTDLGWWCYNDGTRWLTAHELSTTLAPDTRVVPGAAFYTGGASVALAYATPRTDRSLYLTRWTIAYVSDTIQSGVNFWTLKLQIPGSDITTQNTQNATVANGFFTREGSDNADRSTPTFFRLLISAKNGTPGGLWATATVYYRLIIP